MFICFSKILDDQSCSNFISLDADVHELLAEQTNETVNPELSIHTD